MTTLQAYWNQRWKQGHEGAIIQFSAFFMEFIEFRTTTKYLSMQPDNKNRNSDNDQRYLYDVSKYSYCAFSRKAMFLIQQWCMCWCCKTTEPLSAWIDIQVTKFDVYNTLLHARMQTWQHCTCECYTCTTNSHQKYYRLLDQFSRKRFLVLSETIIT